MSKQTANGKRYVYEEILQKKFGAAQRQKTKPSVSPNPSSTHRTATPPRKQPMQENPKSWKEASPLSGSLSVEQRAMIERIFEHYAGEEQTNGRAHLRFNRFRKMVHESKLPIDQTTAELVFYGENRHHPYMHLDVFVRMLPKLSQEIHPEEFDMLSGLHSMLSEYFEPLYKSIMKKTFFEVARRLSGRRLDDLELQTLSESLSRLREVYCCFFARESESQLDNPHISEQLAFEQFVELNRSLGVVPKFIEKGIAISLWREINARPVKGIFEQMKSILDCDMGYYFSWSRFLLYVLCLGRAGSDMAVHSNNAKLKQNPLGFILEYIEVAYQSSKAVETPRPSTRNDRDSRDWTPEPIRRSDTASSQLTFSPADMNKQAKQETTPQRSNQQDRDESEFIKMTDLSDSPDKAQQTNSPRSPETPNKEEAGARSQSATKSLASSPIYNTEEQKSKQTTPSKREWLAAKRGHYSEQLQTVIGRFKNESFSSADISELPKSPPLDKISAASREVIRLRDPLLKQVFVAYSSFGEAEPTLMLNSANFHLLLKEASLIRSDFQFFEQHYHGRPSIKRYDQMLNQSRASESSFMAARCLDFRDAELIFLEFSRIDTRGNLDKVLKQKDPQFGSALESLTERIVEAKMDFEQFINALQHIASKIWHELPEDKALHELIDNHVRQLLETDLVMTGFQDMAYIRKLKQILQEPSNVDLMAVLYKNIQVYYSLYTNHNQKMDFKSFYLFFKDFGICPTLVSVSILQKYFAALVSLEEDNELEKYDDEANSVKGRWFCIDCHQLVEGIALILDEIAPKDTTCFEQRFLLGLKKLDESSGRAKLMKKLCLARLGENHKSFCLLTGLEDLLSHWIHEYLAANHVNQIHH